MIVRTPAAVGAEGEPLPVTVDVAVIDGQPGFARAGVPDVGSREVRDRVRAAVINSGFEWPDRRIDVDVRPEQRRSSGAELDLPIALGILAASGQLELESSGEAEPLELMGAIGELALDGSIRPLSSIDEAVALADVADTYLVMTSAEQAEAVNAASEWTVVYGVPDLIDAATVATHWFNMNQNVG